MKKIFALLVLLSTVVSFAKEGASKDCQDKVRKYAVNKLLTENKNIDRWFFTRFSIENSDVKSLYRFNITVKGLIYENPTRYELPIYKISFYYAVDVYHNEDFCTILEK